MHTASLKLIKFFIETSSAMETQFNYAMGLPVQVIPVNPSSHIQTKPPNEVSLHWPLEPHTVGFLVQAGVGGTE